jgi:hypothetical protein
VKIENYKENPNFAEGELRGNDPTKCNTKLFRQEILKGTYNRERK